jgi:hypothetical protein
MFAIVVHAVSRFPKAANHESTNINTREGCLSRVKSTQWHMAPRLSQTLNQAHRASKPLPGRHLIRLDPASDNSAAGFPVR